MAKYDEEGRKIEAAVHEIGGDLRDLSLSDLNERVAILKDEIQRIEAIIERKGNSISAAESFFKS